MAEIKDSLLLGTVEAEITPDMKTPLSGFIFRENKPFNRIDEPLRVWVFAFSDGTHIYLLISFELLAISLPFYEKLLSNLEAGVGPQFDRHKCMIVATHTHSAPPVSPLEGEADPDPAYLRLIVERTVAAAKEAIGSLTPVFLYYTSSRIPGLTFNRRALLLDGRVSMALSPDTPVLHRGPVDDILTLLVWRDEKMRDVAAFVHFACHGAAVCSQGIHGDIPGEISKRISNIIDAPCIYLQGTTGDINPLIISADHPGLITWCDQLMDFIDRMPDKLKQIQTAPMKYVESWLPLTYQPLPDSLVVEQRIQDLIRISDGDIDSPDLQATILLLADLMNFKPGERPNPAKAAYAAKALVNAELRTLEIIRSGEALPTCPLYISLFSLGQLAFTFIAAELFAISGIKIRAIAKSQALLPVTYAAPIVGYIPDKEAIRKGGYEVNDAWRFYRQPAPFSPESEQRIVDHIHQLQSSLSQ
jgi:hypothetical protein